MKRTISLAAVTLLLVARSASAQDMRGAAPGWAPPAPGWAPPASPYVMGPDGAPRLLPQEFAYDPDMGVPPGYKVTEQKRLGFIVAGAVTFGSLWVASCVAGGVFLDNNSSSGGAALYVPVAGPWISIGTLHSSASGTSVLFLDGLGQIAGAALFIAGMASPQKVLKYQYQSAKLDLTLQPMAGPLTNGAFSGLMGTF